MKILLKSAFAAAVLLGTTVTIAQPANAGVSVGIVLPGAAYVSPYGPGYVAYDDDYYYDPIYIGGSWYHGPYRWQMRNGERMFFVNGRWHRNEWRNRPMPNTIMFRNGGSFRDGRNMGFGSADRINARFRPGNGEMRNDRQEVRSDRRELNQDQRELKDDRQDRREDRRDDRHDDHKN
jgi:hypothetical protein